MDNKKARVSVYIRLSVLFLVIEFGYAFLDIWLNSQQITEPNATNIHIFTFYDERLDHVAQF